MDTNSPRAPKRVRAREREDQAMKMRLAGASQQAIGDALGVSHQAVGKMLDRALDRTAKDTDANADKLRLIEIARLDRLNLKMSPLAEQGSMGAVDRCLRIMERRARLLGLDAPTKADLTTGGKPLSDTIGVKFIDYRVGVTETTPGPSGDNSAPGENKNPGDGAQVG